MYPNSIAATIPKKSAISPQTTAYRVSRIFTLPKYTANI